MPHLSSVTPAIESKLRYLYLIAISGEQVPAANKAAYTYYLSKVGELLTSPSMDTKAIAAIVLDKAGRKKEAQEFVASLKEHLTKTDEQGMFFAFNENPYTWGGMQMQAHVDVMEALEQTGGNTDTVEEMKLWLLKQKQTQQWNSQVATADAVFALLMKGANLLDNQVTALLFHITHRRFKFCIHSSPGNTRISLFHFNLAGIHHILLCERTFDISQSRNSCM